MNRRDFFGVLAGTAVAGAFAKWPERVLAQSGPVISRVGGTLADGSSITISGSAFGMKPVAAPLKYDDFQSLSIGQDLRYGGWWMNGSYVNQMDYGHPPRYQTPPVASNERVRPSTPYTRNAKCVWDAATPDNQSSSFHLANVPFSKGHPLYLDFWTYPDCLTTGQTFSGSGDNVKPLRIHNNPDYSPNIYFGHWAKSIGPAIVAGRDGVGMNVHRPGEDDGWAPVTCGGINNSAWYPTAYFDKWNHIQIVAEANTPSVFDGTWTIYWDGVLRFNRPGNIMLFSDGITASPTSDVYLGNWTRIAAGTFRQYWEAVYIDTSWARVELGNNPVYANCTHREIQIPSAWSSSDITVRLNRGSFAPNSLAYLFVTNSSNVASTGYPVTLGAEGAAPTASAPSPPRGVIIR